MSGNDPIEGLPAPQTSAAAQMRENVAKAIEARMAKETGADWGLSPDTVRRALRRQNEAFGELVSLVRSLPLPPDPHAEQIAALTEALAVATEALRLYADCGFGMARTALARIEAIGGKDD